MNSLTKQAQHLKKTVPVASFKALDEAQGIAEMIVSVFGVVDAANERVMPGFFADSLKRKLPKGVWAHDWSLPVAKTLEARELMPGDPMLPESIREHGGLYIKGQFNLSTQRGREAFSDLVFGAVDEFSFGYSVSDFKRDEKTGVTDLLKGDTYEWSPVLVGCNPATVLMTTKDHKGQQGEEFKAAVLGEWVEAEMTMGAISRLNDALFYGIIASCIFNYRDEPLSERLARIEVAIGEFSELTLRTVRTLLEQAEEDTDEGVQAKQAAVEAIKALWRDPKQHDLDVLSLTEKTLEHEHSDALTALERFKTRAAAIQAIRAKQGRVLSQANTDRLSQLLTSLGEVQAGIQSLLDAAQSIEDPSNEEAEKAFARFQEQRMKLSERAIYA